ncbi:MAG: hypothetical protein C4293_01805 [Nitrospiraceae bacterium]
MVTHIGSAVPITPLSGSPDHAVQRIRVCFISPLGYGLYQPGSGCPFGGAEVQFFLLAHALSEDPGFQVSVLTTVEGQPGLEQHGLITLIKRRRQNRLRAYQRYSWLQKPRALKDYAAAFLEMRSLLSTIDADVYLHAGAGVEVGAYALICRLLRRRFVYVVASSAEVVNTNGQVAGPLNWLFPVGLRLATSIICRTQDQLTALQMCHRKSGILIRTGHPLPTSTPAEKSTVLWVGRIHPVKQPKMFLDLAEHLPREKFVMVAMRSKAHESLTRVVRERATRLSNLTLVEDVAWADISRYFESSKVLVNTSIYEGFPNTFVQAAMHRVAIVSWNVDPDGIFSHNRIGICAQGSFERLVGSVEWLCKACHVRIEFGQRGLEYARKYHDLSQSATELKAFIRSLVADILLTSKRSQ